MERFHVFRIVSFGDDFEEALVSGHAAHIFGRSGARTVDTGGLFRRSVENQKLFHNNSVMPVVAEIIDVGESGPLRKVAKPNVVDIEDARIVVKRILGQKFNVAVAQATDPELEKMIVPPIERRLKDKV